MNLRKIALIVELIITLILWGGILAIPHLEYDYNYAVLLYGLIFSTIAFGLFYAYWKHYTKNKEWRILEFVLYFMLNSPFTFVLLALNQHFKG